MSISGLSWGVFLSMSENQTKPSNERFLGIFRTGQARLSGFFVGASDKMQSRARSIVMVTKPKKAKTQRRGPAKAKSGKSESPSKKKKSGSKDADPEQGNFFAGGAEEDFSDNNASYRRRSSYGNRHGEEDETSFARSNTDRGFF
jgi:hypothetical protein